ncbi:MAG TPA: YetF domain-containing protein [bacterium]|nr:YetF domain-containing protein [bacterium]
MWHNVFVPELSVAEKVIRPVLVYLFLVIAVRLAGRRQLAQLNSFDLVVLMMLANTVQNATIGNDNSMVGGLIGVSALLLVNYLVTRFLYRQPKIDRLLEGAPTTLIKNGKIIRENLVKETITEEELMEAVRKQGFGSLGHVAEATLERGGVISVVPRTTAEQRIRHVDGKLDAIQAQLEELRRLLRPQDAQPS